jgi:hypothetical protein
VIIILTPEHNGPAEQPRTWLLINRGHRVKIRQGAGR